MKAFKKKNKIAVSAVSLMLGASLLLSGCSEESAANPEQDEVLVPVEVAVIAKSDISSELSYAGQVKPKEQVYVLPKASGKVSAVYYDVGDRVNVDDVLFLIDEEDVRKNIATLQAQYNAALQGVNSARNTYNSATGSQTESTQLTYETAVSNAEIALQNAQITLDNAKIALDDVEITYNNSTVLYQAGTMSQVDYDRVVSSYTQAQNAYTSAQNGYSAAEVTYNQAKESLELFLNKTKGETSQTAQTGLSSAQATANVSRVQLDNAISSLNDLNVKSPITGIITARNVEAGATASPSSAAFTVVNMDTVNISVNISEELINIVQVGQPVDVLITTISDTPIAGTISTISPAADEMTSTYPIQIELDNPDHIIKPGMFAEVSFAREESVGTIVLPRNTVLKDVDKEYVYVVENGTAKKREVITGIDNGKDIEIVSGLSEGEHVIVTGHKNVSDSTKVNVVTAEVKED